MARPPTQLGAKHIGNEVLISIIPNKIPAWHTSVR
jgi:hypothetical protein